MINVKASKNLDLLNELVARFNSARTQATQVQAWQERAALLEALNIGEFCDLVVEICRQDVAKAITGLIEMQNFYVSYPIKDEDPRLANIKLTRGNDRGFNFIEYLSNKVEPSLWHPLAQKYVAVVAEFCEKRMAFDRNDPRLRSIDKEEFQLRQKLVANGYYNLQNAFPGR